MIKIHYKILRYQPDRVSGEFVNLGIVAFDTINGFLKSRFAQKVGKISGFFSNTTRRHIVNMAKSIQDDFDLHAKRTSSELKFADEQQIDAFVISILPKDDSALYFTEIKKGLDENLDCFVDDMFLRLVKVHLIDEDDKEVRNDKQVWNKIYKKHFDANGISNHLATHKVKTKNDELEFDKAWKNGVWNCFEPLPFNLTKPDTIKDKVYKWVGKLDELSSTKESLHIYLLGVLPLDHPELNVFIQHKIKRMSSDKLKVELVLENNIEKVVKKIKKEIDQHY